MDGGGSAASTAGFRHPGLVVVRSRIGCGMDPRGDTVTPSSLDARQQAVPSRRLEPRWKPSLVISICFTRRQPDNVLIYDVRKYELRADLLPLARSLPAGAKSAATEADHSGGVRGATVPQTRCGRCVSGMRMILQKILKADFTIRFFRSSHFRLILRKI